MFLKCFHQFRRKLNNLSENYPSALILLGIINGIFPGINGDILFSSRQLIFLIFCLPIFSLKNTLKFTIMTVCGIVSCLFFFHTASENYTNMIPEKNCGAIITAKITDTSCAGKDVSWLPSPRYIKAEVIKFKYTRNSPWHETVGSVSLKLPEGFEKVSYGDILELQGSFVTPSPPLVKGGFDYKNFLLTRGMKRIFYSDTARIESCSRGISGYLLKVRNFLMNRLASGIRSDKNKKLAAALIFGCKQGLDWDTRESFIKSGVIHIFTVSGLHVGILALILGCLLRPLPFRARYLSIPFLIMLYVFCAGFNPPAVRALLMISLWCFFRAFLYYTSPLNIIFLAASIILLLNPLYITDMGFQYSFMIAGILILSSAYIWSWQTIISEKINWIPSSVLSWKTILKYKSFEYIAGSFMFCLTAWLASSGITLFYQGLYLPFSVFTNIVMVPFVLLIFIVSIIKLFLEPLFIFSSFLGLVINSIFQLMTETCAFISEISSGGSIPKPPLWSLILFYAALPAFITAGKKRVFISAGMVIFAVAAFWHLRSDFQKDFIIVAHGGQSQEPSVAICSPSRKSAVVINAPSWDSASAISDVLQNAGISNIDAIVIKERSRDYTQGLKLFTRSMELKKIIIPENYTRSTSLKDSIENAVLSGTAVLPVNINDAYGKEWSYNSPGIRAFSKINYFIVEYFIGRSIIRIEISNSCTGRHEVLLNMKDLPEKLQFLNSSKLKIKKIATDGG